ncbi:SusC/RagA family TonB-linked outer membrane protein [Flavobacterium sp. I3-2]|uniref:SusC/RagA family TonB-linked outer membrane protein n=1 Tax=Flavobacterium sp. I3-2 TaxID=2748319 RepID=UPI0015AFA31B|nr:SusC/RagA family TonB-linked outer membrane protein [Flavobacterium sp. I3-2]
MKKNYCDLKTLIRIFSLASLVFCNSTITYANETKYHFASNVNSEKILITGVILNENGKPLEGASVHIKGTNIGSETNALGVFSLESLENDVTLVVNYLGYVEYEMFYTGQKNIVITMLPDLNDQMEEMVITALGIKREEKQLGYAQQKLGADDFTDARSNNWVDNMKGKVAGMTFTSASSGPMSSTQVVLRGNRSIDANANGALIVVDGIPINSGMVSSGESNGYLSSDSPVDFGNGMSDINPEDIESVTVLKGAGATALYGSRAANGAIMITTKSGKKAKGLGITYSSNVSVDVIQRWPDWQTQYGSGTGKAFNADGDLYYSFGASEDGPGTQSNLGFGPKFDGQYYFQYDPVTQGQGAERTLWQNYDNARKGFWKTGNTVTNSLSFEGGDDKGSMRASLTHTKNEWIMPNTGFDRTVISTKGNYQISKNIKLNSTINFSNRGSDNLPLTGYNNHSIAYFMILTNPNTNLDWYKYQLWKDNSKTEQISPFSSYLENPYVLAYEVLNSMNNNTLTGNLSLDIDFTKNLKLMVRSGINTSQETREQKRPYDLNKFAQGYYSKSMIHSEEINTDFLLTYKGNESEIFNYSLSVGGNNMVNKFQQMTSKANGLVVPGIYKFANALNTVITNTDDAYQKVNSMYALGSFSYKNQIFLDLTARNDWSSTLPAKNNSYFYPSANLSVIMSDIINMPLFIDFAKIRGSWAQVGNDSNPYLVSKYYNNSDFAASAVVDTNLFNSDLKPELTTSFEVGADMRFLHDRIGFDFSYYNTVSENQIIRVPVDYATGYTSKYINAGKVLNRGIEVTLHATPLKSPDFEWKTTFTYSKNHNEILELAAGVEGGDEQTLSSSGTVSIIGKVGGSTGDMYGYGFVRNDEGKIIYNETTGLPVRPDEVQKIGNAYADWKGGWTNNFKYKNFTLGVTIDGSFGGTLYSQSYHKMMEHGKLNGSLPGREEGFIIGDGVIQNADGSFSPNTTKVDVPGYYSEYYRRANVEANSFDATYVKLREISFTYTFPKSFLEKTKLKGLSLSIYGRNLYTWSDFPIYDPETAALNGANMVPGVEMGQMPSPATYGFNLKVSL